jgi:hypothetical protein
MSRIQLIQITWPHVYFFPNKKKYLLRIHVWIYRAETVKCSGVWIDLDQDRKKWWAVVSTVMNVIFKNYGKFLDKMRKYIVRILSFLSLR